MAERHAVPEPFRDLPQKQRADRLGIQIFLASEIMLFGGLFAAIATIRYLHPEAAITYSRHLQAGLGAFNTLILLTSSLCVALAVEAAKGAGASHRRTALLLFTAVLLGAAFLGLKAHEYASEYVEGLMPLAGSGFAIESQAGRLFMNVYLVATSLHAVHLGVGIAVVGPLAYRIARRHLALPAGMMQVEVSGAYWHLVDVIWIFLYPSLYLVR